MHAYYLSEGRVLLKFHDNLCYMFMMLQTITEMTDDQDLWQCDIPWLGVIGTKPLLEPVLLQLETLEHLCKLNWNENANDFTPVFKY